MRTLLAFMLILALMPATLIAQDDSTLTYRFVNLTENAIDLYGAEDVILFDVPSGNASAQRRLEAGGEVAFAVYARNDTPDEATPLLTQTLTLQDATDGLVILSGAGEALRLTAHVYDTAPVAAQRARVEVLHLAETGPLALVGQNNDMLIEATGPDDVVRADVPAGSYQYTLRDDDDNDLNAGTLDARPGRLTTLIVYGTADDLNAFSLAQDLPQQAAFRLVHAGRIAPDVDVYFDDVLLFSNVAYQDASDYTALDPGTYTVGVYDVGDLPGSDTPIWSGAVELTANAPRTGVIMGEASLRLITYLDDHQLIPAERSRLRVINAALNLPLLTVRVDGQNTPLVGGLEYALGSGNQNLEPGPLALTFRETEGIDLLQRDFSLLPNHYYTLVTVGNALVADEFSVLVLEWTWQTGSTTP